MCWFNVLKTPLSTHTGNTVARIAFETPVARGISPPFEFSILSMHFSVSWQILRSPSDGSLRPPFVFHETRRSGIFCLVVVKAAMHSMQWIFFFTILTT